MTSFKINILILFFSIGIFHSCKQREETTVDTAHVVAVESVVDLTDAQFKNAQLQLSLPEKMNIGHVIYLNGKIEVMPENSITVSSPMAGFVRQIKLMPGMKVSKGQTLVRLEEKEYIQLQQDYLSAKNALAFAKLDFDRQSELSKNQAASEKVLQQADEKVRQNQILVKSLGEKLKLIHINPATLSADNMTSQIIMVAPASGTIAEVLVNSGKYVQAGEAMIRMIDNTGAKLVLKAFEKDLPYLQAGQKLLAFSNAKPDQKLNGKIDYIVNTIGDQGFANIICSVESQSMPLLQGMYMNAEIEANRAASWTVPNDAIVSFEGKEYVFFEKGNQSFEMLEIQPGQKESGKTQIINFQIFTGKKIVTKGAYTLLMKMKNVAE
ncbi:MAG: efflux RND transporter periplasmic adaptor subunit [Saprospiraceae bacterium]|nr:efflux RND transporter periplasmic adaptor subunit [Saprospiraceae bacterium]